MSSFDISSSEHFSQLEIGYRGVADRTWQHTDFLNENLEISRDLFTPESLASGQPRPKALEVYALLSGLPFGDDFSTKLVDVQKNIDALLGNRLSYWVSAENLGLEYCVFKWPTDEWDGSWLQTIKDEVSSLDTQEFQFNIGGVQVNPDGCVVAKGFDEGGKLFKIRETMKSNIPFLPKRQSGWAHVPLGRILEPVGEHQFAELQRYINSISNKFIASTKINKLLIVHETRWYMEERTTLAEHDLLSKERG